MASCRPVDCAGKRLRGRLVIERTAGKDYTTRAAIREMRRLCQLSVKVQGSGSGQRAEIRPAGSSGKAAYIILDAGKHHSTGCFASEADRAERKLAEYIASKYQTTRKERDLDDIYVADVLSIYVDDCGPRQRNRRKFDERIGRLNDFWGGKRLSEVNGESCRAYVRERGNLGGARRDLEDLRAGINHHANEGLHRSIVRVTLPEKGLARDRWLTRSEAARLLWICWRHRELQVRHRGPDKGRRLPTNRYPLRHLARFILIGLYTGTRAGAIASASPRRGEGRSFVDLERGIFYRLAEGAAPFQKAPAASSDSAAALGPSASLARQGHRQRALRRMEREADLLGEDRAQDGGEARQAPRQGHSPHPAPYSGDLADAERREHVACGGISWDERRDARSSLRSPSPGLLVRCGGRNRT